MQNPTLTIAHPSSLPQAPADSQLIASVSHDNLFARKPLSQSIQSSELQGQAAVALGGMEPRMEQAAIDVYLNNHMVAHSVENYSSSQMYEDILYSGTTSFSYCSDLLRALRSAPGVKHLSSTILVHDVGVKVYRNTGILFNRQQAELSLFSKGDANSNVDNQGHIAGNSDFTSAEELIKYIATTNHCDMNEVKANFLKESIVGVYFCKMENKTEESVIYLKALLLLQKLNKDILGGEASSGNRELLRYDPNRGAMVAMKTDHAEKFSAYLHFKQRHGKDAVNAIAYQIDGRKAFH